VTGEGTFTLSEDESGDSTHVEWRERLAAPMGPLGRWGMRLLRPLLQRQFQRDLERLKALCES
jgi:hypothetical protein